MDPVRLRALEQVLLQALAVVREAIEAAEHDDTGGEDDRARYVIQWRWVPVGQRRRGDLHTADCWMARGDTLDIGQVSRLRQDDRYSIEPCDACRPGGGRGR